MSDKKIELYWDENGFYAFDCGWNVIVSDWESGSSTSFGGSDPATVIGQALQWLGVDVDIWRRA